MTDRGTGLTGSVLSLAGSLMVVLALASLLVLAGCPLIDAGLASEVEDETPPVIVITNPEPGVPSYYSDTDMFLTIAGRVEDYSDADDEVSGRIELVGYAGVNSDFLSGSFDPSGGVDIVELDRIIQIDEDGNFEFQIKQFMPGEYRLSGNQRFAITATDWNGNVTEVQVTLYAEVGGAAIGIITPSPEPGLYSSLQQNAMISGEVDADKAVSFTYTVVDKVGEAGSGQVGDPTDIAFSPVTGYFSFSADPAGTTDIYEGALRIYLTSEDIGGEQVQTMVTFEDDKVAPIIDTGTILDNTRFRLTFDEPIYSADTAATTFANSNWDLAITYGGSPGTDINTQIIASAIEPRTWNNGVDAINVPISFTGTPNGNEEVTVTILDVTDLAGNPVDSSGFPLDGQFDDEAPPYVTLVTTDQDPNDHYNGDDTIIISVLFDEPIVVLTPPTSLALTVDGMPASAAYMDPDPGAADNELRFTFTPSTENGSLAVVSPLVAEVRDSGTNVATNPNLVALDPTITIDTTLPDKPLLSGDSLINIEENELGAPEATLTITALLAGVPNGSDGNAYTYALDAASVNCTIEPDPPSGDVFEDSTGTAIVTLRAGGHGPVEVVITVSDLAGNSATSDVFYASADLQRPDEPTVTFADGDGDNWINVVENGASGVQVTVDNDADNANALLTVTPIAFCSANNVPASLSGSGGAIFNALATDSDEISFEVTLEDAAGNTRSRTFTRNADIDPPDDYSVDIEDGDGWINDSEKSGVTLRIDGPGGAPDPYDNFDFEIHDLTNCGITTTLEGTLNTSGNATRTLTTSASGGVSVWVTVTDQHGNDSTAVEATSIADLDKPIGTVEINHIGTWINNDAVAAGVTVTVSTLPAEPATSTYAITATPNDHTTDPGTGDLDPSGEATEDLDVYGNGNYTVAVSAYVTDAAGNVSDEMTDSVTADLRTYAQPTVTILDGGDEFIDDSEKGSSLTVRVRDGRSNLTYDITASNCTAPSTVALDNGGDADFTITPPASDTLETVSVTVTWTNSYGNTSTGTDTTRANYTAAAPTVSGTPGVGQITWSWTSNEPYPDDPPHYAYNFGANDLGGATEVDSTNMVVQSGLTAGLSYTVYVWERDILDQWSLSGQATATAQ